MAFTPAGGQQPLRPCCDGHGKERRGYVGASIQGNFLQAASVFAGKSDSRPSATLAAPGVREVDGHLELFGTDIAALVADASRF